MRVPFFSEITSRHGLQLDPHKLHMLTDGSPLTNKRDLQYVRYYELHKSFLASKHRGM